MRTLLLSSLLFLCFCSFGQNEGNIWYFGHKIGLDFRSGSPAQIFDGAISTLEGCASFCDADGNLLFYTNGGGRQPFAEQSTGIIWNRDHDIMYDMQGREGGGFSAFQSSVIIPKPGNEQQYYLFTMEEIEYDVDGNIPGQDGGRGLSYFEIDMTLNGGLGGVTVADQRIFVVSYEGLCAIRNSNERDFWILVNNTSSNSLQVFSVSTAGVQIAQELPINIEDYGTIKASPDGRFIGAINRSTIIARFDPGGGNLINFTTLNDVGIFGEFSANSRYFYMMSTPLTGGILLLQYDLEANDINNSRQVIWSSDDINTAFSLFQMQLAPDGNIYVLTSLGGEKSLSVISCPNSKTPSFEYGAIPIIDDNPDAFYFGLPNFPNYIFAEEALAVEFELDTLEICTSIPLIIEPISNGDFYKWSTGETTPSIEVIETGWYTLTVTNGCEEVTDSILLLNQSNLLKVDIEGPTTICPGFSDTLRVSPGNELTYLWSDGSLDSILVITGPGNYSVTISDECGGLIKSDKTVTSTPELQDPTIDGPETLCNGIPDLLVGDSEFAVEYKWSTGETTPSITADQLGSYSLTVTDVCGRSASNSITLIETQIPLIEIRQIGQLECPGDEMLLSAETVFADQLVWSTGDSSNVIGVQTPGQYELVALNECFESRLSVTIDQEDLAIYIPNVFSPNDDGINDLFRPFLNCPEVQEYQILVFSRWGELLFESENLEGGWDGKVSGEKADTGVYTWIVEVSNGSQSFQLSGDVMLLR